LLAVVACQGRLAGNSSPYRAGRGLLGGTLNGALVGRDVIDFNAHPEAVTNTRQFVVAPDVKRFLPHETFTAEVDRHVRELRNSKALPGHDAVRLPGEHRQKCRTERLRDGLVLAPELLAQLDKLAAELAIKPLAAR
jgi:L-2-hydroxycarboxylate dehydrogenase (NAD+)